MSERKSSDARIRATAKYNAKATKQVPLRFNLKTDADILEKLYSVDNIQGYIKQLIRDCINLNIYTVPCFPPSNAV